MIQKGQIEKIISPYQYKVRIPRYDKLSTTPGGTPTEDLSSAIVCSVPGTKVVFAEGDIVLVDFENNELNKPVILGLLYREEIGKEDQFYLPTVEKSLNNINKQLKNINEKNLYVHTKYSNDNGITLTSLYEYTDIVINSIDQNVYRSAYDIEIDSKSSTIYWSIIDANNNDVTNNFEITTTLKSNYGSETFHDSLIEIPLRLKGSNIYNIKLDFSILEIPNFDDYHIVLTTDKNTLGSVYGDYLGIYVSSDIIAPLNPTIYSWISFKETAENIVSSLSNNLLPRVERIEEVLYGFNYSNDTRITNNNGILDGIFISENNIDIHGIDNKDIIFNSNKSMFIDNKNNSFTSQKIIYTTVLNDSSFLESYTDNQHLSLVLKKRHTK